MSYWGLTRGEKGNIKGISTVNKGTIKGKERDKARMGRSIGKVSREQKKITLTKEAWSQIEELGLELGLGENSLVIELAVREFFRRKREEKKSD